MTSNERAILSHSLSLKRKIQKKNIKRPLTMFPSLHQMLLYLLELSEEVVGVVQMCLWHGESGFVQESEPK